MRIERWLYTLPLRLRSLFRRKQLEQELDDELRFHLEQHIDATLSRGARPEDARAAALQALDRMELRKEECRDMRRIGFIDNLMQDLRYAVRVLRRSPAFTAVAILSLALGIGANTAIFSVMDVLLLRPLPVRQPNDLQLVTIFRRGAPRYAYTYPLFEQIRDRNTVFSETFAWDMTNLQTPVGDDMLLVPAVYASGDYFNGLGIPPTLGRTFGREDDRPDGGGNGPVAVIGDAFWQRRFARSPSVIGRSVVFNGTALTIIGVMPPGFFGAEVGTAPDVWVPLNLRRRLESDGCIASRSCWFLRVMGRLKPGVSEQQAAAELRGLSLRIMEATLPLNWTRPDLKEQFLGQVLQPEPGASGFAWLRSRVRAPLRVLMALVGLVLLIACTNLANLLAARASARSREVAIRLAMGAARTRVIRQFLTESLLLSIAGGAGGFLIALWSTRVLIAMLSSASGPEMPDAVVLNLNPDWRVLLFTAAAAVSTGILFGLGPAFRATRAGLCSTLKERAHQIRGTERRPGFGDILLSAQVALSIVLLAAAGLFAASLIRLMTESAGFDPNNVTVVSLDISKRPEKGPALTALLGRIMKRARTLPGVESASLLFITPLSSGGWDNYVIIPGRTDLSEEQRTADINAVGPQFFETMRIPILSGRDFRDSDDSQSEPVAVIGENTARRWFPNGDAVGAQIGLPNLSARRRPIRIVGIVGNIKYLNLRDAVPQTLYLPYTQTDQAGSVAIRTEMPLRPTYAAFREMLRQVAPGTPIRTVKTMRQQVDESLSTERLTAYLSLFIAMLALLLTAVGLYGILAYSVARRTGEIGIRMALGAQRGSVVWLVIREVMGHTVAGAVVGIAAVFATSKAIASLLYEVHPNDPATLALAVASLALVCLVAAWLPARRASRLDPMAALRED